MVELATWIGRTETRVDDLHPFPANALAATLDRDDTYAQGDALPPLWHWLHFLPVFKRSAAGYDGHAALGGFLPPVPLPRRMWAGSALEFHTPLRLGQTATKVSTIERISEKTGRSGPLVFVTVGHETSQAGRLAVRETHDIVYRAPPAPGAPLPEPPVASEVSDFSREITPDPVLLFRYSALTFNGHRIHYDQPFATGSEGYPGLVVHGPLLATLLLDLVHRTLPAATVTSFRFKATATVTDTAPFTVHGTLSETSVTLWIRRADGALAMQAEARIDV
ncbi:FAS1-like dehydratase domain-containing protein [Pseudaestuariivita sp.]|uniref:FAS1-like dehydratase domain-containing protein n=1 Tax=Pseudaestuariivita sp. TaxID=2211669 RepID=UPI004058CD48